MSTKDEIISSILIFQENIAIRVVHHDKVCVSTSLEKRTSVCVYVPGDCRLTFKNEAHS